MTESIDDAVRRWHDGEGEDQNLHEFLGMTWEEFARWAETRELRKDSPWFRGESDDS